MALPLPGWSCCPRGYFPQMIHVQVHSSVKSAGSFEQAAAGITSAWQWLKGAGTEPDDPAAPPGGAASCLPAASRARPHWARWLCSLQGLLPSSQAPPQLCKLCLIPTGQTQQQEKESHECVESEQPESTTLLTGAWAPLGEAEEERGSENPGAAEQEEG